MNLKPVMDYIHNQSIKTGLITHHVTITRIGKSRGVQHLPIRYVDNLPEDMREENIVNLIDLDNPEYVKLDPNAKFIDCVRNETLYDPWQISCFALWTPSSCDTIEKVRNHWGTKLELSYRQARKIRELMKDFPRMQENAINYFLGLSRD